MAAHRRYKFPEIGDTYGRWTVVNSIDKSHVRCQCNCGRISDVTVSNLYSGKSTGCDSCAKCLAAQTQNWEYIAVCSDTTIRRRLLNRICAIVSRCTRDNSHSKHYKDRGITVLQEWVDDRTKFLAYLLTLPGYNNPVLEIDRIDNDKGYIPGNLRFTTRSVQMRNRNIYIRSDTIRAKKQIAAGDPFWTDVSS